MNKNPLLQLAALGQSVWLDYLSRAMLDSGELRHLIENDDLRGVTSNPSTFEKAIGESRDYDDEIAALGDEDPYAVYIALALADIERAADLFRPTFERLGGRDGFVSLEVSPRLAYNTAGTIAEARALWAAAGRDNVMIKVPGTREGITAIRTLTADGLNINVTLLFGIGRYEQVADAYLAGLEERAARGEALRHVASVASFFLSRIDALVDGKLERIMEAGGSKGEAARALRGEIAIASARFAHVSYERIYGSARFARLAARGARTQRLLWASTGTKNPAYSDVKYVEPLIGRDTINTMPRATLDAYRDHGKSELRLATDVDSARRNLERLASLDISIEAVADELEREGVQKFAKALDALLAALQRKRGA